MSASHRQLRALVEQALDLPGTAEREALLAACPDPALAAEARALLGLQAQAALLEAGAASLARIATQAALPERIGPYRIVGLLGSGGMGAVYRGVRDDGSFHKDVAIKVVRDLHSAEQIVRFERERALLARLEHPAIARVLDGGCTDVGLPWMAIERVQGLPLDQYAREQRLSVRERVLLLQRVIDAVQYAHQNLIVHRDLKPANVLVQADGQARLLDFGVAKLLGESDHTQTAGRAPMTFAYAAPEQIKGEAITTATDVYALGVMLYELLTGERPHRPTGANPLSLLQAITDTDASAPSEWLRRRGKETTTGGGIDPRELRGDLDTIVLKALSRDPTRRYPSAQALSDDLARWLSNRPIHARADTGGYRLRKWIRRNRLSSALGAGLVLALALAAAWILRARNHALEQAEIANATKRFLVNTFTAANRWKTGREVTAVELTLRGLEQVAVELQDYPQARIEMYEVLGHTLGRASPLAQGARARELLVAELRALKPGSEALERAQVDLMQSYWFAEMLPQTRQQRLRLERDYAESMSGWMRMVLGTLRLDPPRMQGDYPTLLAAEAQLPAWQAVSSKMRAEVRSEFRALRTHFEWGRLDALTAAARDGAGRESALAMLRHIGCDLAGQGARQANYTSFVIRRGVAFSPERRARARAWIGAHFGEDSGFALWMDLRLLDLALREQDLARARTLFAGLEAPLRRFPDESLFELRDLGLLGAELALASGDTGLAAGRWRAALELSRHSDANLVFARPEPFESHYTRQALAGLAWLDAQAGQPPDVLAAVAARQAERGDGAWRRSAAWLAELRTRAGDAAAARALLESILAWQSARGADPDARLDPQFARSGLRQHAAVALDPAGQAELDQLFDASLQAGEAASAAMRADR